jgi:hypothetical protein
MSRGAKAWLVTWEHMGAHAKPEERIAAVLSPRWSEERVRQFVELLYANATFSVSERIAYMKGQFSPYPAQFDSQGGVTLADSVHCGANPWLFARRVNGLVVSWTSSEGATWQEPDRTATIDRLGRAGLLRG